MGIPSPDALGRICRPFPVMQTGTPGCPLTVVRAPQANLYCGHREPFQGLGGWKYHSAAPTPARLIPLLDQGRQPHGTEAADR